MEFVRARIRRDTAGAGAARLAFLAALTLGLGGCLGYDVKSSMGISSTPKQPTSQGRGFREQILVLLGSPTTTSTIGGDAWYYVTQVTDRGLSFMPRSHRSAVSRSISPRTRKSIAFQLRHGDGKLIDFVSRTTPTARRIDLPERHVHQSSAFLKHEPKSCRVSG